MKHILTYIVAASIFCLSCCDQEAKFTPLFNGENLDGFVQLNGKAEFRVEDGVLVGVSTKNEPNSFLATENIYGNFILEFEVLCDAGLNSGVQFRSSSDPAINNGRVSGYQCDIDTSAKAWSGGIYDEAGRGWLAPLDMNPASKDAFVNGEWNRFRIEALGDCMRVWVNGVNTANIIDNKASEGFIALQIHAIGKRSENDGKVVKWRDINILTEDVESNLKKGDLTTQFNYIPNTLSEQEVAEGWELLFDGASRESLEKLWRNDNKDDFPAEGWNIADGALSIARTNGKEWETYGNIITRKKYSAFELSLEFKITEGANSGIKYFTIEESGAGDRPSCFGLEYQLLDDATHEDAALYTSAKGSRRMASLYDMIPATQPNRFRGVDEWNRADIVAYPDGRVIHYLNGAKMLEFTRGTAEYQEIIANSKYAAKEFNLGKYPFGTAPEGHILLQDHGCLVFFRSIKIKDLTK